MSPKRIPLLDVEDLSKSFSARVGIRRAKVSAVDGVNLSLHQGGTLGVVGESGCGKSTLARLVVGLIHADAGTLIFDGHNMAANRRRPKSVVRNMQMVFQDPHSALNPRATIGEAIAFPLRAQGTSREETEERVGEVLRRVALHGNYRSYYPHQLSGGQRQRVNIARALALKPKLVVLDEAVSALDKSIQAQILDLLKELQEAYGLSYLFISHDLNVVEYMSDDVAVMYLGHVVERCSSEDLYRDPLHPYTQVLLASIPKLDPRARKEGPAPATGEMPSPLNPPSGCRFRTRCPFVMDQCAEVRPEPVEAKPGHWVACHLFTTKPPAPPVPAATDVATQQSDPAAV
jgi:oligopeptide/dipeptide ABC transporter ATP-binding protein